MGIDATLFVIADYSCPELGFVEHVLRLKRDRGLWPKLEDIAVVGVWSEIQLPHGAFANYHGETPEGFEDCEGGHLQRCPTGSRLLARRGRDFGAAAEGDDFNSEALRFVAKWFPNHQVVVFWS